MKYNINLVQKRRLSFFENLVYFLKNYLRYILVITQFIVILTLFARFQIDQNIIDLKESIGQKKEIVDATSPLIKGAQAVNDQTTKIKAVLETQNRYTEMTNYIFSVFPASISLNTMSINKDSVKMEGSASNPRDLQLFFTFLKNGKRFRSVTIDNINKEGAQFHFSMNLNYFQPKK